MTVCIEEDEAGTGKVKVYCDLGKMQHSTQNTDACIGNFTKCYATTSSRVLKKRAERLTLSRGHKSTLMRTIIQVLRQY